MKILCTPWRVFSPETRLLLKLFGHLEVQGEHVRRFSDVVHRDGRQMSHLPYEGKTNQNQRWVGHKNATGVAGMHGPPPPPATVATRSQHSTYSGPPPMIRLLLSLMAPGPSSCLPGDAVGGGGDCCEHAAGSHHRVAVRRHDPSTGLGTQGGGAYLGHPHARAPLASSGGGKTGPAWTRRRTAPGARRRPPSRSRCAQPSTSGAVVGSEDCLYLNVFVPASASPAAPAARRACGSTAAATRRGTPGVAARRRLATRPRTRGAWVARRSITAWGAGVPGDGGPGSARVEGELRHHRPAQGADVGAAQHRLVRRRPQARALGSGRAPGA